ncbi:MAG: type IV secretory system conjugative DNA transfer family protein [Defluviitaleaceae bacterium]|nr:type IV secretory system conjugative DNA transfer family protein [Defluviitaleaceae bacterium]
MNIVIFAVFGLLSVYLNTTFNLMAIDNVILAVIVGTTAVLLYIFTKDKRKYRKGIEHGSARWGAREDIFPFMDFYSPQTPKNTSNTKSSLSTKPTKPPKVIIPNKIAKSNIILTATEGLTMTSRPKLPKHGRNKNVLVFGGSGSGKTRFFGMPNIMQMHSSYVITDPKGELYLFLSKLLKRFGYDVRVLNLKEFDKSMGYNPFDYINKEDDILKVVNVIQNSTTENTKSSADGDFWTKSEKLLYMALIGYIKFHVKDKTLHNMNTLVDMVTKMEVRENDETFKSQIDKDFERIAEMHPNDFAVRQYRKFKQGAGKTLKSIIISCGVRLSVFDIAAVRRVMEQDQMKLETIGDRKTALFIITDDSDTTYNFIAAMLYTQMFNVLINRAETKYASNGNRLPIHVRCILDEFANLGKLPNFQRLISTIRSREISACIIVQSLSQIKEIYKDSMNTIISNCDSKLFLGGDDEETLKYLTRVIGKETIDTMDNSETKGKSGSFSKQYKKQGRELMTTDELARLDGGKCVYILRGVPPFLSEKYDIEAHPVYPFMQKLNKIAIQNPMQQANPNRRPHQPPQHPNKLLSSQSIKQSHNLNTRNKNIHNPTRVNKKIKGGNQL